MDKMQDILQKSSASLEKIPQVSVRQGLSLKIILVVLPLLVVTVLFLGVTTYFSSNNGITGIAKEFVGYKMQEVFRIAQQQYFRSTLLPMEGINVRSNILDYAQKFTEETLIILPFDGAFEPPLVSQWASQNTITLEEVKELYRIIENLERSVDAENRNSWLNYNSVENFRRVGVYVPYIDMEVWLVMLMPYEYFYSPVRNIMQFIVIILIISLVLTTLILLWFVRTLTQPLRDSVATIRTITENIDLTRRIKVHFSDEIGVLGQYFNDMVGELESAYNQVKNYAYQTVLAKRKEEQIRFIFQKYVPSDVIDYVLNRSSDSLLGGNRQQVSILFSDIRDFTSISEQLRPEDLVISLNAYFNKMVDEILSRNGIVDKFIGDAIMAVFGAPKVRAEDADNAIEAALGMVQALESFNQIQKENGRTLFQVGVGINTGSAIVGNIGSEQKIDFTVIGDSVNLASRLEGLTKSYRCPVLISQFTKDALLRPNIYFFLDVDTVRVKGKDKPVKIYRPMLRSHIPPENLQILGDYHLAQSLYYSGAFAQARETFLTLPPIEDLAALVPLYIERCDRLIENPPSLWDGVETWNTK